MKTKALHAILLVAFFVTTNHASAQGAASKQLSQVPAIAIKTDDLCEHDWEGTITNASGSGQASARLTFSKAKLDSKEFLFAQYYNASAGYSPPSSLVQIIGDEIHFWDGTGIWRLRRADTIQEGHVLQVLEGDIVNRSGGRTALVKFIR